MTIQSTCRSFRATLSTLEDTIVVPAIGWLRMDVHTFAHAGHRVFVGSRRSLFAVVNQRTREGDSEAADRDALRARSPAYGGMGRRRGATTQRKVMQWRTARRCCGQTTCCSQPETLTW